MATIISMEPSTSNPNPNPDPPPINFSHQQPPNSYLWSTPASAFKPSHHRRAFSDVSFHIPRDVSDPFNRSSAVPSDDIGSDEDIFSKYIDVEKLCDSGVTDGNGCQGKEEEERKSCAKQRSRPPNRQGDILKSKKAMPANKLAELWIVDPKRAKRILANRQSAARSKERKARYIVQLEKRVQSLDIQSTTLATQLNLYQRDVADLAAQNAELKLHLQTMEHQIQLREDLNEALKREVERLRIATGTTQQVPLNQCGTHFSYPSASPTYQIQSSLPASHHNSNNNLVFHQPTLCIMHHQPTNNNNNNNLVFHSDDDDPFSCSLDFDIGTIESVTEEIDSPSKSNTVLLLPPTGG